jgi:hypothetical protein
MKAAAAVWSNVTGDQLMSVGKERKRKILQRAFWDRAIDPEEVADTLAGTRPPRGWLIAQRIMVRLLESVPWYDILEMLELVRVRELLGPDVIGKLRSKELQSRYDFARRVLQGESLSLAGWDSETRARAQNSTLSHRWYRTLPGILRP